MTSLDGSLFLRPATSADVHIVAVNLRTADARSLSTATGKDPHRVLQDAVDAFGAEAIIAPDGELIGLCGVSEHPAQPGFGVVWMCGTNRISRYRRLFVQEGRLWIERQQQRFAWLGNRVDVRNKLHVRWIGLMGFRFTDMHDVNGHPFAVFVMGSTPLATVGRLH